MNQGAAADKDRRATHYEVLGVTRQATHDDIRRAFRRQARLHHPDSGAPGVGTDNWRMAAIALAWEVLGDPRTRAAYDEALRSQYSRGPSETDHDPDESDDQPDDDGDGLGYLDDLDDVVGEPARPGDLLLAAPVVVAVLAVITFWFAVMWRITFLRTAAILMVPVAIAMFVAAPLFAMLRSRRRREANRSG